MFRMLIANSLMCTDHMHTELQLSYHSYQKIINFEETKEETLGVVLKQ